MALKMLYRITLLDEEQKQVTVYAAKVEQADFLGFIEISGLEFPKKSDIILTVGEDKARTLFKDTEKIIVPGNMVIRIEELKENKRTDILSIHSTDTN